MSRCSRGEMVEPDEVQAFHITSRCVRRAFLCGQDSYSGKDFSHRRKWIQDLTMDLIRYFCLEMIAMSIMSNHMHHQLRTRPDLVNQLTDDEVARRWLGICPKKRDENGMACPAAQKDIDASVKDKKLIDEWRKRLSSISWFARILKQRIARMSNAEDETDGRFWQGRFKSTRLDDDASSLASSVYIDINEIRAELAETPETSTYSSIWYRILAHTNRVKKARGEKFSAEDLEADRWLAPFFTTQLPADQHFAKSGHRASDDAGLPIDLEHYIKFVDWTGRQIREDKRGSIPSHLAPILERIGVREEAWFETVRDFFQQAHRVVGCERSMLAAASAIGQQWLQGVNFFKHAFRDQTDTN